MALEIRFWQKMEIYFLPEMVLKVLNFPKLNIKCCPLEVNLDVSSDFEINCEIFIATMK